MSLIYITGAPGAGKSTIQKELISRGFEAHDIDEAEFGGAHNKASGKRVAIPPAEERPPEWYNEHEWRVDRDAVNALKNKATDKPIFVCGVAPDDERILALFDKIYYLKLDEEELKQRIAARTDNDYGKNDNELSTIIERQGKLDARYASSGAIIIDAIESPARIIDNIIAHTMN